MKKFDKALILSSLAFLLAAFGCSDSDGNATGIHALADGEELPACNADHSGELYLAHSGESFYCNGKGSWQELENSKGNAADSVREDSLVKRDTLVLSEKDTLVIFKKDTLVLRDTVFGANGESCSAEALPDGSGYKILCGGDSVGVIAHGAKGDSGSPGSAGNGCTLSDEGNGTVNVICATDTMALYKAVCGTEPYDPAKSFCLHDKLYAIKENSFVATEYLNPEMLAAGKYGYLIDTRDSQIYRTIQIGTQTWMAQNLNYNYPQKTASQIPSSCCYDNDPENCAKYGRLYLWSAAMDSAAVFSEYGRGCGDHSDCTPAGTVLGICPKGWHLPSKDEFTILRNAIGKDLSAIKLKTKIGWDDYKGSSSNGTNDFGFSALPTGSSYLSSGSNKFEMKGLSTHFWAYSGSKAQSLRIDSTTTRANLSDEDAGYFHPIRCLKD